MLADRRSAIYNTYTRNSFDDSLEYENENGECLFFFRVFVSPELSSERDLLQKETM